MLASTDFETKQIRMVSLPRDSWIPHYLHGEMIREADKLLPKDGIYAVRANGMDGVAHLGPRPTFPGVAATIEVHRGGDRVGVLGPSLAIYEPGFLYTTLQYWEAGRLPAGERTIDMTAGQHQPSGPWSAEVGTGPGHGRLLRQ